MDVEISNLVVGKTRCTEEVHFTGGLRGLQVEQGWALVPIAGNREIRPIVVPSQEHLDRLVKQSGSEFIGTCTKYEREPEQPPNELWEPGARDPRNGLTAGDSWSAIAFRAWEANDKKYSDCASYVSACLRAAGIRLRDVSNGYHDQLRWALVDGKRVGAGFSNAAMLELYVDFHSLASEICSARDFLGKVAAIQAGASGDVDSMVKLEAWFREKGNPALPSHTLAHVLAFEMGRKESNTWLRQLGTIRNEMLHRIPLGRNPRTAMMRLQEWQTSDGPIRTIRFSPMSDRSADNTPDQEDLLVILSRLSRKFEELARAAWPLAKYPAKIPEFVQRS